LSGHELFAKSSVRCRLADPGYWERCHELGLSREGAAPRQKA
jgi:hypothetical protein